jgi:hypothetical protein
VTPDHAKRWHAAYVTYAGNPPVPVANVVELAPGVFNIKCAGPGRRPTVVETVHNGTLESALDDAEQSLRDLGWNEVDLTKRGPR